MYGFICTMFLYLLSFCTFGIVFPTSSVIFKCYTCTPLSFRKFNFKIYNINDLLILNLLNNRRFCEGCGLHRGFQELMNKITGFTRTGLKPWPNDSSLHITRLPWLILH